jgi:Tol biopolymer transport system component
MSKPAKTFPSTLALACLAAATLSGTGMRSETYLGEVTPGLTPQRFAPGVVSTEATELNIAIAPDGSEVFLTERRDGRNTLVSVKRVGGKWGERTVAEFSGEASDVDPFFSKEGDRLYFSSNRPVTKGDSKRDSDLWYVDRLGLTKWGAPVNMTALNSPEQDEYYTSIDDDGTIYFSVFPDHDSPADIFRSHATASGFGPPERLPGPVNTELNEHDPFIARDGSWLIFTSNRPGGHGRGDLWISFRGEDGSWNEPKNMGSEINSAGYDFCPALSPNGAQLFFTRNANGTSDVFWVDAGVIDHLREAR